jgi:hypothetical protein
MAAATEIGAWVRCRPLVEPRFRRGFLKDRTRTLQGLAQILDIREVPTNGAR